MTLRRSQRKLKPRIIWEEKGAPSAASDPKITLKSERTDQKTALKPIATEPFLIVTKLNEKQLPELLRYDLSLELRYESSKSLVISLSELNIFQQLLTPAIIEKIVKAINIYIYIIREIVEELPFSRL
jgi:hypothetical protein